MTPRTVLGLAIVTLIATCAAVWAVLQQPAAGPAAIGDELAFPALRKQPEAVAKVVITTPSGEITLVRGEDDRWVTPDRDNYPIAADKLRELIFQLADMRLVEAKTNRPDRYARLQVEDVGKDAKSHRVRLEDGDGTVLAEAIFGKQRQRLTGTEPSGIYLRRPDEAQSWLASGGVDLDEGVADWLDQEVVALDGDSVRRLEISPASGEAYAVARDAPDAALHLEGLADGEKLKKDANLKQLLGGLATVRLEDVKPADKVDWPEQEQTVRVTTFDGLEVTLHLAALNDKHWLRVDAKGSPVQPAGEAAAAQEPATTQPAAEEQAAAEEQPAGAKAQPAGQKAAPPKEDAATRARTIAARTDGWAYQVSDFVVERLTKPRSEWLEDAGTS